METYSGENNEPKTAEDKYLQELSGELDELYKENKDKILRFLNFIEKFNYLVVEIKGLAGWIYKEHYVAIKKYPNGGNVYSDLSMIIDFLEPNNYNMKKLTILLKNLEESRDYEEFITKIDPTKKEIIKNSVTKLNFQLAEIGLNKYQLAQIDF